MYLLIDDVRDLGADAIARNPAAARRLLALGGWETVGFDHDLGDVNVETGYQVLVWAIDNNFLPNHVQLVTSNPAGRMRMAAALRYAGFDEENPSNFRRVTAG
jgi:hypothetical protein